MPTVCDISLSLVKLLLWFLSPHSMNSEIHVTQGLLLLGCQKNIKAETTSGKDFPTATAAWGSHTQLYCQPGWGLPSPCRHWGWEVGRRPSLQEPKRSCCGVMIDAARPLLPSLQGKGGLRTTLKGRATLALMTLDTALFPVKVPTNNL
jgi:hypothetical protein